MLINKLLSTFALLAIVITPVSASALDRIAVTFTNGDLYAKEGPVSATWTQLTGNANISNYSLDGSRIAVGITDPANPSVSIKEPGLLSQFNQTYFGSSQPQVTKTLVSTLSDGTYRLLILRSDGNVMMKDGPYNAAWWSGYIGTDVKDIFIGNDNIGILTNSNDFKVKVLTPQKFSHPNNVDWITESTGVSNVMMGGHYIGYVSSNNSFYAKDDRSSICAANGFQCAWSFTYDSVSKGVANGDGICVIKLDTHLECKQGAISATSKVTYNSVLDVKINSSDNRIAVMTSGNSAYVLSGTIYGANSGWNFVGTGNIASIELN